MKFSVHQVSRKGGRERNEDRMGYCFTKEAGLFAVADGMGGHPEGEVASELALQTLAARFQSAARPTVPDPKQFLADALLAAHRQILKYATDRGMLDSPRTTLVAAVVQHGSITWVHCGDSRLYHVRGGALMERTRDHSYLELRNQHPDRVLELGADAERVNRHVLFTCLGSPSRPVFNVTGPKPLEMGDRILLCSDGLWSSLGDTEIVHGLASQVVSHAVPDLVERALRVAGSSSDNVTALAMEWETPDAFPSTHGVATDTVDDHLFQSTILGSSLQSMTDEVEDELDEEAIERTIAEINEAIRRTAARSRN